ncbi:uncharacterized protein MONOS_2749 [Monocercomonoides exilis]|uniref:uncharacterized protein n=1 Tax=Monocercomonoides exilis TaxID=2049356 RepID=UPI003559F908|nr:hypothetical protein MONOS_2749 [Monocercomonoides exilis]|eukprot:MONOS_2749.1-p1 / transcript=MONOS_2749.1 / gene=MONOS_2749 / organism=Monocercomonoides_exilis_PA203 / gene_product=unspecified product / transcript_product=unspecified product / location=Mono_scaffold00058:113141-117078(-) / protein_length=1199 / sequence_SO=supercontig / SO=protein_coding / is_pseudo=false
MNLIFLKIINIAVFLNCALELTLNQDIIEPPEHSVYISSVALQKRHIPSGSVILSNDETFYACIPPQLDSLPPMAYDLDSVVAMVPSSVFHQTNQTKKAFSSKSSRQSPPEATRAHKFPTNSLKRIQGIRYPYFPNYGIPEKFHVKSSPYFVQDLRSFSIPLKVEFLRPTLQDKDFTQAPLTLQARSVEALKERFKKDSVWLYAYDELLELYPLKYMQLVLSPSFNFSLSEDEFGKEKWVGAPNLPDDAQTLYCGFNSGAFSLQSVEVPFEETGEAVDIFENGRPKKTTKSKDKLLKDTNENKTENANETAKNESIDTKPVERKRKAHYISQIMLQGSHTHSIKNSLSIVALSKTAQEVNDTQKKDDFRRFTTEVRYFCRTEDYLDIKNKTRKTSETVPQLVELFLVNESSLLAWVSVGELCDVFGFAPLSASSSAIYSMPYPIIQTLESFDMADEKQFSEEKSSFKRRISLQKAQQELERQKTMEKKKKADAEGKEKADDERKPTNQIRVFMDRVINFVYRLYEHAKKTIFGLFQRNDRQNQQDHNNQNEHVEHKRDELVEREREIFERYQAEEQRRRRRGGGGGMGGMQNMNRNARQNIQGGEEQLNNLNNQLGEEGEQRMNNDMENQGGNNNVQFMNQGGDGNGDEGINPDADGNINNGNERMEIEARNNGDGGEEAGLRNLNPEVQNVAGIGAAGDEDLDEAIEGLPQENNQQANNEAPLEEAEHEAFHAIHQPRRRFVHDDPNPHAQIRRQPALGPRPEKSKADIEKKRMEDEAKEKKQIEEEKEEERKVKEEEEQRRLERLKKSQKKDPVFPSRISPIDPSLWTEVDFLGDLRQLSLARWEGKDGTFVFEKGQIKLKKKDKEISLGTFSGFGPEMTVAEAEKFYGELDKPRKRQMSATENMYTKADLSAAGSEVLSAYGNESRKGNESLYFFSPELNTIVSSTIPPDLQKPYFSLYFTRNTTSEPVLFNTSGTTYPVLSEVRIFCDPTSNLPLIQYANEEKGGHFTLNVLTSKLCKHPKYNSGRPHRRIRAATVCYPITLSSEEMEMDAADRAKREREGGDGAHATNKTYLDLLMERQFAESMAMKEQESDTLSSSSSGTSKTSASKKGASRPKVATSSPIRRVMSLPRTNFRIEDEMKYSMNDYLMILGTLFEKPRTLKFNMEKGTLISNIEIDGETVEMQVDLPQGFVIN